MNIVHIGRFDAAAAAFHHSRALCAAGHASRVIVQATTHVAMQADIVAVEDYQFTSEAVQQALAAADVIIGHVSLSSQSSEAGIEPVDLHEEPGIARHRNKLVLWADGSRAIRSNPVQYKQRYAEFRGVATNHDIAAMLGFKWMPACIEAETDAGGRMWREPECQPATLAHPYSDAILKGSGECQRACGNAGWSYREVTGLPLGRSLRVRGLCAATFDHFQGYFGLSTMEASAMGQPCAVGYSEDAYSLLMDFCGAPPPWRRTLDPETLSQQLRNWSASPLQMAVEGAKAREWHEQHFTNAIKVAHFLEWLG